MEVTNIMYGPHIALWWEGSTYMPLKSVNSHTIALFKILLKQKTSILFLMLSFKVSTDCKFFWLAFWHFRTKTFFSRLAWISGWAQQKLYGLPFETTFWQNMQLQNIVNVQQEVFKHKWIRAVSLKKNSLKGNKIPLPRTTICNFQYVCNF